MGKLMKKLLKTLKLEPMIRDTKKPDNSNINKPKDNKFIPATMYLDYLNQNDPTSVEKNIHLI